MICSREKLRRLGNERYINIDINKLIKDEPTFMYSSQLSGVMRFDSNKDKIKFPAYKILILSDNKVYYYRKLSSKRELNFSRYDGFIEFRSFEESECYWKKYIGNDIIRIK